jgi:hypothetical protein
MEQVVVLLDHTKARFELFNRHGRLAAGFRRTHEREGLFNAVLEVERLVQNVARLIFSGQDRELLVES